jgi:hypothetical protein
MRDTKGAACDGPRQVAGAVSGESPRFPSLISVREPGIEGEQLEPPPKWPASITFLARLGLRCYYRLHAELLGVGSPTSARRRAQRPQYCPPPAMQVSPECPRLNVQTVAKQLRTPHPPVHSVRRVSFGSIGAGYCSGPPSLAGSCWSS